MELLSDNIFLPLRFLDGFEVLLPAAVHPPVNTSPEEKSLSEINPRSRSHLTLAAVVQFSQIFF